MFDRNRMYLGLIEGDTEDGSLLAGQIAGLIEEIKPVREIIDETIAEAERIIGNLSKPSHRDINHQIDKVTDTQCYNNPA